MSKIPELAKDYVFHYDKDSKRWCAVPKEMFTEYWKNPTEYESRVFTGESVPKLLESIEAIAKRTTK